MNGWAWAWWFLRQLLFVAFGFALVAWVFGLHPHAMHLALALLLALVFSDAVRP